MKKILFIILFAIGVLAATNSAHAAIAFVSNASTTTKSPGISQSVTVPSGGWAAGTTVIVFLYCNGSCASGSSPVATDTVGNAYSQDIFTSDGGQTILMFHTDNISALSAGQKVTISSSLTLGSANAMDASNWSGLNPNGSLDAQASVNNGSVTAEDSGFGATTTASVDLLLGGAGAMGPIGDTWTVGGNGQGNKYTLRYRFGTTGNAAGSNATLNLENVTTTALKQYKATSTLGTARVSSAFFAAFKEAPAASASSVANPIYSLGGSSWLAGSCWFH